MASSSTAGAAGVPLAGREATRQLPAAGSIDATLSFPERALVRILVAEDDRVMSQLLCAIVREGGHTPIPAFDAMQTMMFAIRPPVPDLIILDLNMPGGSGLDALRKLKLSAKTNGTPVVVVSGSTEPGVVEQVMQLGAVSFVGKPIVAEALMIAVRKALGQPAATPP
jgi:two-component system sensor histidine kinase RpfC